jgi:hypothetical protein
MSIIKEPRSLRRGEAVYGQCDQIKEWITPQGGQEHLPLIRRRADESRRAQPKCSRQTGQRGKRRSNFAAFDLANIRPWYIHPASEFPLREALGSSVGDDVQRHSDANGLWIRAGVRVVFRTDGGMG